MIFSIIDLAGVVAQKSRLADLTSTLSVWLLKTFQSKNLKLFLHNRLWTIKEI